MNNSAKDLGTVYVIDRFEGQIAILETQTGASIEVPRRTLPSIATEGDIVQKIPRGACGESFAVLHAATEIARRDAAARIARLKGSDPGGDIEL